MRAILFVSTIALAACSADAAPGHGDSTSRTYDVGAFNAVSLEGSHDVIIKVGAPASVRAEGDSEALDQLKISVENGSLKVEEKKHGWNWGSGNRGHATIYVTVPSLKAAALGGSGNIRIDRVEGGNFSASLGGSGNIDLAAMQVGKADFSLAGSGNIKAAGKASSASISIAGSGNVNAANVEARTASVSIMGSGDADIRALDKADVVLMGSGDANISGGAKCSLSKMGSGSLRCSA
jgi:Putative auto-transporter adhesin, head GIN domain